MSRLPGLPTQPLLHSNDKKQIIQGLAYYILMVYHSRGWVYVNIRELAHFITVATERGMVSLSCLQSGKVTMRCFLRGVEGM